MWNAVNLVLENKSVCGGLCTITAGEFADFFPFNIARTEKISRPWTGGFLSSRRRSGQDGIRRRR